MCFTIKIHTYITHKLSRRHSVTKKAAWSSQVPLFYSGGVWFKFPSGISSVYPDNPISQKPSSSTSFAIDSYPVPRRCILYPIKCIVEWSTNKDKQVFSFTRKNIGNSEINSIMALQQWHKSRRSSSEHWSTNHM